ncbi:type VI-B CRISPR-associated RNA-guided ribonuclease Cas13b [Sphingobacterium hungaricum]|uniref:Uncharacterized protein n=1 Tax=Sphingobacterium hungaricum TaxID=2082723 RepID=A0A928YRJ3_9SPHI|nr:type VI-B CRISPR-associated RNA-guided ribonuclease Cas13b [Sphingobacterium hungaricum]MBE8715361.1 hypothetical protein [Sphingobacterium hungaricum]
MNQNTERIGRGIQYNHTKIEDKHYFAGYLNLAVNNKEEVFSAFKERYNGDFKTKFHKDTIHLISPSDYTMYLDFLKQYLPVVNYLDLSPANIRFERANDKELSRREYFLESFTFLISAIESLRNFYTHYFHKPIEFDQELFDVLDDVLFHVIDHVKKTKKKDDKTKQLLKSSLKQELITLEKLKRAKLQADKAEGKRVDLTETAIKNAVFNDAFYHLLYKDGINRNYEARLDDTLPAENNISISQSGLVFLMGMFLKKKEGEDMRGQITGYKAKVIKDVDKPVDSNNNSLKYMATHWVFSYLGFKGLKRRLTTTFSKETLLIQIVDELSKVPDEVYQSLSPKKQEEFVEDVNQYYKDGLESQSLDNALVVHPVIRKRYEDKFNYFVIRYLDEFRNFDQLRFQIFLGNYVHDRRVKQLNGLDYQTERTTKKAVNVFGKLADLVHIKSDYFVQKEQPDVIGWEEFPHPSYNFVAGNIPIQIRLNRANGDPDKHKAKQGFLGELLNHTFTHADKANVESPDAMLSLNELPGLLYALLNENNKLTEQEIERIYKRKLFARLNVVKNYNPDQQLPSSQITTKLKRSNGNGAVIDVLKLINAISREIEVTDKKLEFIRTKSDEQRNAKPPKRYMFGSREVGQEATWLANDLKRFMPIPVREQWKGYHHSQLQQSLAYYSINRNESIDLLSQFWNFEDKSHAWNQGIKQAFDTTKTFEDLYKKYLSSRKQLLSNYAKQIEGFQDNNGLLKRFIKQQSIWTIFYERLYRIDKTEDQINKLLSHPVAMPRGLFDDKPTFILGEDIHKHPEKYADWYSYAYQQHAYQSFYAMERDCSTLFDQHRVDNESLAKNKKEYTHQQQVDFIKLKQDQKIKKVQMQDLYLNLIVKDLFEKVFGYRVELSLKDYYLTQAERIKREQIALQQSQRVEGDASENIINDSFIWGMTVPYMEGQIEEPKVRLKDLGKFKSLIHSSKAKRILSYNPERTWTKLALENELQLLPSSYEVIRRDQLFSAYQQLEKNILLANEFDGVNHPSKFELKGNPNLKLYITEGILRNRADISSDDIDWIKGLGDSTFESEATINTVDTKPELVQQAFLLIYIRNKFAHNQLLIEPYMSLVQIFLSEEEKQHAQSYSELILSFVRRGIGFFNPSVN